MDNREMTEKVVLSFLYHNPSLLFNENFPIKAGDFSKTIHKRIFTTLSNMYATGTESFTNGAVTLQLNKSATVWKEFQEQGGPGRLAEIENVHYKDYEYNAVYGSLKKFALLKDLKEAGIDVGEFFIPEGDPNKAAEQVRKMDEMTYKDIIDHYQEKLTAVEDKYENFIEKSGIEAGDGLDELLHSFEEQPEIGMPLVGDFYNTITRGARRKKVYLNSASSGVGKSRAAAGNVAKLGFPYYYDEEKDKWIETGMQCPVLFITTELEHSEVQTMFLAYISGVNEEKIIGNRYDSVEEKERVEKAKEIAKGCHNVFIEFIPNPSIESVAAKIRLYALQKDVEYVFYDYVHVSSATYATKKEMRDDIWLMLFMDKLKQLANELDIHISTATQVNASSYEDREIKNEALIRGSKAVADKTDFAMITSGIQKEQEKALAKSLSLRAGTREPNQILDVYKNRRGKWRGVRIWRYADLGTCRAWDCFVTDTSNNPLDIKIDKVRVNQMVKEGSFPIIDADTGEIVAENRKVSEVSDF